MGWFSNFFGGGDKQVEPQQSYQGAGGPAGMTGSESFQSGVMSAAERREQILADAQAAQAAGQNYNLNTNEFTGHNLGLSNTETKGKLREGMTGSEYHDFMRQLHGANPAAMKEAFPFASGNVVGGLAKAASGLIPGGGVVNLLGNVLQSVQDKGGAAFDASRNLIGDKSIDFGNWLKSNKESGSITDLTEGEEQIVDENQKGIMSIKEKYGIEDFFPMSRDNAPQFTPANLPLLERFPNLGKDPSVYENLDKVGFFERGDTEGPSNIQKYIERFKEAHSPSRQGIELSEDIQWSDKKYETLGGHPDFQTNLSNAPDIYKGLYERMINEQGMTDEEARKNLNRIAGDGGPGTMMFPAFSFKDGGIISL
jgi:hypothetical protein